MSFSMIGRGDPLLLPDEAPICAVTGGTGAVGKALVRQLASDLPHHRLVLLTRRPERSQTNNITSVFADITLPDLGLAPHTTRLLEQRAEFFFHCAADTRFNLPVEEARQVNTEGTRHTLALARGCRNLRHFAHISTLYVVGRREGMLREEPLAHHANYVNSYERSKHEAEDLVLADSAGIPSGIYRLSSVVDLAGTSGHFRQAIRFVAWSTQFPFFPADPTVPVDIISSEWAARAISALVIQHGAGGCIRHVCAGQEQTLSVETILDRAFAACETSIKGSRLRPTLVPLADFERLRLRLPSGSSGVSRALDYLSTFVPHLCLYQAFDCSVTSKLLAQSQVPRPDMDSLVSAVLAQEFSSAAMSQQPA